MMVKIEKRQVNVWDRECPSRECFTLGFDKGHFAQGRGYTSYHTDGKGRRVELRAHVHRAAGQQRHGRNRRAHVHVEDDPVDGSDGCG